MFSEVEMEIGIIFKIAAVGILVSVVNQLLAKSGREEQALLVTLSGMIVVLSWIIVYISDLFESIKNLFNM